MLLRWTNSMGFIFILSLLHCTTLTTAITRRCWTCESRGEYGDCKDPFAVTPNNLMNYPGVSLPLCSSGWCAKVLDSNDDEQTVATRRFCLPTPPDDNTERCAETRMGRETVYMCFCMGDLCNEALSTSPTLLSFFILTAFTALWNLR